MANVNNKLPDHCGYDLPFTPPGGCIRKLPLPMPETLALRGVTEHPTIRTLQKTIEGVLAPENPFAATGNIELLWEERESPGETAASPDSRLSLKQQIYDDYFSVYRRDGGNDTLVMALAQVVAEVSLELESEPLLEAEEVDHLADGLRAVLESGSGED